MNFKINANYLKAQGKEAMQQQIHTARATGMTWDEISQTSPVSRATLQRWANQEMAPQAQKQRQSHPRREQLLSQQEKEQLLLAAKERREKHEIVSIDWTRQTINSITKGRVQNASNAYISKFWKSNGWPSRKTQERNSKEVRPSLEQEVEGFREEVSSYVSTNNIPSSRIFTMDETGLWNGSVSPRTYVDPSTMDVGVVSLGNHRRDTGVVAISASGVVHPHFISHSPQKTRIIEGKKL